MKAKLLQVLKAVKAKWPLLLICLGIVGSSFVMLWKHYTNVHITMESDFIYKVESKILDLKFRIRGPQRPTGQIGILAIDEKAITRFGDWPFSRRFYGQALRNLKKMGVKFVGFDAIYADPQITRLDDVKDSLLQTQKNIAAGQRKAALAKINSIGKWLTSSPGDLDFANAIRDTGNVILGFFYLGSLAEAKVNLGNDPKAYFEGLEDMQNSGVVFDTPEGRALASFPTLRKASAIKANIALISKSSDKFAFFSNDADDDAINRWVTLVVAANDTLFPSLGLKAAAEHLDRDIVAFFNNIGVEGLSLVNRKDESDAIEVPSDPHGAGRLLVNHRGPGRTFKHYSLADAYFNSFSAADRKELKGMTLLLGGTATGTQDLRPNPFDPAIDGVENHAAVADNIIKGDFLKRDRTFYEKEIMIVLAVGLIAAPFMIWGSSVFSGLAVLLFLSGYLFYDWTFWFNKGIWAYVAVPCVEIVALFVITTFYKYVTEEREKKAVKGAFQHYLSPAVINQLLDDPSSMALGGTRKEITVFFSDVRDFTSISEGLKPEELCEFMNDYFTPMTTIILNSGGTLDKYIGDAIMAFWGAPIAAPNHAELAARSCIQMMYALDKLREDMGRKNLPKPDIGMGLNSTAASVGNMGSHARFSYTAMGDGVNLGSRLESLTKAYGVKVLMSQATVDKLPKNEFFMRNLDDIRVKGKEIPVRIFELMRPDYVKSEQKIRDLIGEFELGREAYRKQDWALAEKHMLACFNVAPNDGPTHLYMKRIQEYKEHSPGPDWDMVHKFEHK